MSTANQLRRLANAMAPWNLNDRLTKLERKVSALRDYVDAVNTETTEIGENLTAVAKKLDDAIASGDPQALADLGSAVTTLQGAGDRLRAMATGTPNDPLPQPQA